MEPFGGQYLKAKVLKIEFNIMRRKEVVNEKRTKIA